MSTGKQLRRHYKVKRLPEALRARVDRSLAEGKSYLQIADEVTQAGHPISDKAIRHYWRDCWRPQHERIQWMCAQAEALSQLLRQTGESDEAVLVRKLLLGQVLARMQAALEKSEPVDLFALLRESREMVKATRQLDASGSSDRPASRDELRRRLREIYGWPEEKRGPESVGEDSGETGKSAS